MLNNLICDENFLTRTERLDLVRAIAAIGAIKDVLLYFLHKNPRRLKRVEEKKEKVIEPRFPNAGIAWNDNDESILREVLDPIPTEKIGDHLFWLAEKLGRIPYSMACKIAQVKNYLLNGKIASVKFQLGFAIRKMTFSEYIQAKSNE